MLILTSFLSVMATTAVAQDDVFDIEFGPAEFVQNYSGNDGGWHTTINNGEYEFSFDILGKNTGLESGKTYTLDNMNLFYSYYCDIEMGMRFEYQSVEYTETIDGAQKKVEINALGADNILYHLTGKVAASGKRPVYMPEDLEEFIYTFEGSDSVYGESVYLAGLAFDGDDVYLQGIGYYCSYFKSAIKGKKQGTDLVFPAGQFLGAGKAYETYIYGYDAESGKLCDLVFYFEPLFENYVSLYDVVVYTEKNKEMEHFREATLVPEGGQPSSIEQIKEKTLSVPAKRWEGNRFMIRANGKDYDVLGR